MTAKHTFWEIALVGFEHYPSHSCDPTTACSIVLRKIASPCRWKDVECNFGMWSSALNEVFWEVINYLVEARGHILTDLHESLLVERASLEADKIRNTGAPLESCAGILTAER